MTRFDRPTRLLRVTLSQEIDTILPAEDVLRRVSILTPAGEPIVLGLDVDVISRNINETQPDTPQRDGIGPNEHWRLASFPANTWARFHMLPGQWLVGAVESGVTTFPIVVEYPVAGDDA